MSEFQSRPTSLAGMPPTPPTPTNPIRVPALAQPVGAADRIISLDVLRGVAVLGILLLNIQSFSMIGAAYMNPNAAYVLPATPGLAFEGVERTIWHVVHLLGDQKFMAIFSMLFGAGIIVFTSRLEQRGRPAVGLHYRRMGWLILFGVLHAHLLWFGDILYTYGMCGLLLYLLRRLPPWAMILGAMASIGIAVGISLFFGWSMPHWPPEAIKGMSEGGWLPTVELAQMETDAYRGGWLSQMRMRVPGALMVQTLLFFVFGLGFKALGLMLLGMALFKLGILSAKRSVGFYLVMAIVSLSMGLPIVAHGIRQQFAHDWDVMYSFFFGQQFNYVASVFVALGYVALVMLVCKLMAGSRLLWPLAATGRMALTNYIAQTVICTTIFYGHGFGYFGQVDRVGQMLVVAAVWLVQLIWSPLWLAHFRYGPLEWLWRSLSYGKRQGLRRSDAGAGRADSA